MYVWFDRLRSKVLHSPPTLLRSTRIKTVHLPDFLRCFEAVLVGFPDFAEWPVWGKMKTHHCDNVVLGLPNTTTPPRYRHEPWTTLYLNPDWNPYTIFEERIVTWAPFPIFIRCLLYPHVHQIAKHMPKLQLYGVGAKHIPNVVRPDRLIHVRSHSSETQCATFRISTSVERSCTTSICRANMY